MVQVLVCAAVGIAIVIFIIALWNRLDQQQNSTVIVAPAQGYATKKSGPVQSLNAPVNLDLPLETAAKPTPTPQPIISQAVLEEEEVAEDEVLADFLRQSKTEEERRQILEFAKDRRQKEIEESLLDETEEEVLQTPFAVDDFAGEQADEEDQTIENTKELFRRGEISFIPSYIVTPKKEEVQSAKSQEEQKAEEHPLLAGGTKDENR